ncbi:MAG: CBS domain-containing protein [Burkholderiales bacterium]|nr:CBS domain-containing protein [Phycisphaerae bacterium]
MPSVAEILSQKTTSVVSVNPTMTVLDATQLMNLHRIGSVCVVDDAGSLIGVFSERDVLTRVVAAERSPNTTVVGEVMTSDPCTCTEEIDLDEVAEVMRDRRVRHIPVIDCNGALKGMISIGDINAHRVSQQDQHIQMLNDYVYGRA